MCHVPRSRSFYTARVAASVAATFSLFIFSDGFRVGSYHLVGRQQRSFFCPRSLAPACNRWSSSVATMFAQGGERRFYTYSNHSQNLLGKTGIIFSVFTSGSVSLGFRFSELYLALLVFCSQPGLEAPLCPVCLGTYEALVSTGGLYLPRCIPLFINIDRSTGRRSGTGNTREAFSRGRGGSDPRDRKERKASVALGRSWRI